MVFFKKNIYIYIEREREYHTLFLILELGLAPRARRAKGRDPKVQDQKHSVMLFISYDQKLNFF